MIAGLPWGISWLFIIATAIAAGFFIKACRRPGSLSMIVLLWLFLQSILAFKGFYLKTAVFPPRLLVAVLPPLLCILLVFCLPAGRRKMDSCNTSLLALLHIVRIPVEIGLWCLFLHKLVPQLMTFEGRNFDIIAGLTAPFAWYLSYKLTPAVRKWLVAWNIICLLLLLNIVINAVLSVPGPLQKQAFEQPNLAVLYFPFIWLPSFIVPVVLFSHLVCLRALLFSKEKEAAEHVTSNV